MSNWTVAGKVLAVAALMVTPFAVVASDPLKPYVIATLAALQAASVYCAHVDNANGSTSTVTKTA